VVLTDEAIKSTNVTGDDGLADTPAIGEEEINEMLGFLN